MSIRSNGRSGNGEPSPWFKQTIAELKEMQHLTIARIARAEDEIEMMKRDLAESKRQTRELMLQSERLDAARSRDTAMIAELLSQHNVRLERLEKRK